MTGYMKTGLIKRLHSYSTKGSRYQWYVYIYIFLYLGPQWAPIWVLGVLTVCYISDPWGDVDCNDGASKLELSLRECYL